MDENINSHEKQNRKCLEDIKSCRICLLEGKDHSEVQQDLIAPCLCSGSIEYTHNSCILKWINELSKKNMKLTNNNQSINCEICKYQYRTTSNTVIRCINRQEFSKELNRVDKFIFIITILIVLAILAVFGVFLNLMISGQVNMEGESTSKLIIIIGSIVLIILAIILTIKWLYKYAIKVFKVYTSIEDRSQKKQINQRDNSLQHIKFAHQKREIKYQQPPQQNEPKHKL